MSTVKQPLLNPELVQNPLLAQWISVQDDGSILLRAGKVELGQGIGIVQLQIVAEELEVPLSSISLIAGHTAISADQGYTSGSNSVQVGAMALRQAAAQVRALFIEAAAQVFNVQPGDITLHEGLFSASHTKQQLTYADLTAAVDLNVPATGQATAKAKALHHSSGHSVQRPDLQKKLFSAGFIHDLEIEGMLHGRIIRPPSYAAALLRFDPSAQASIMAMPGVQLVYVTGRFIGVCALREEQAVAAAIAARSLIQWEESATLPAAQPEQAWLRTMQTIDSVVDSAPVTLRQTNPQQAETAARSIQVNYSKPFIAHASIGPSCALAQWSDDKLTVWTHGQGSFPMRRELANLFSIAVESITVIHADGAGCYGHNGADDAAFDAAMLARAAKQPVRLQWSREDEFGWSPHGSAMSIQIDASIDLDGKIETWHQQIWSHTHVQRPGMAPGLKCLAGLHREPPAPEQAATDFALSAGGGGQRNAVPLYDLPGRHIVYHLIPQPTVRSSALRALGAYANVFAIESCMDELASLAKQDPVAFRLRHLKDSRAQEVLKAVARQAGWAQSDATCAHADSSHGRGVGFARYKNTAAYCAVIVDITVTDRIVLDKIWVAVDAGEIIHPDGLINQIEGGVLQAASWTLKEALQWDDRHITTQSWGDYPILRFDEIPTQLSVHCLDQTDLPPLGVGECAAGPTAAAIANALYQAIGVRMRDLPLTPERLAQAVMRA